MSEWYQTTTENTLLNLKTNLEQGLFPAEAKRFGFSRYPVYDKQIDNIVGYVHIKDLIWGLDKNINLERCVRETIFIPGNATLPEAFTKLTTGGKHMCIASIQVKHI